MEFTSPLFQKYAIFTGHAEGGLSNNPNDSSAKYVKAGQYHTNRGIIWPTFQAYAKFLGIEPSYINFLALTKDQANRILYAYYKFASKGIHDALTGLILTNIYWGSGNVLGSHTRLALREMGLPIKITGSLDQNIKAVINEQDPVKFNNALLKVRRDFLTGLAERNPKNKVFLKGWLAREDRFKKEFLEGKESEKKNNWPWLALILGGILFFRKS